MAATSPNESQAVTSGACSNGTRAASHVAMFANA
jgi:hypothetical protein